MLPTSCHPGFITDNIPYSLAYRLVRIESTQEGLDKNLTKLEEELVERGYGRASVKKAINRARALNRDTILKKVPRPENKRPMLSMLYDPQLPSISSILKKRH